MTHPAPKKRWIERVPFVPSERKFYQTMVLIEILSEEPVTEDDVVVLTTALNRGEWSASILSTTPDEVDAFAMARLLERHGSDPGYFRLNTHGEDET